MNATNFNKHVVACKASARPLKGVSPAQAPALTQASLSSFFSTRKVASKPAADSPSLVSALRAGEDCGGVEPSPAGCVPVEEKERKTGYALGIRQVQGVDTAGLFLYRVQYASHANWIELVEDQEIESTVE